MISWLKNNRREALLLLLVILVAAFLRFYKLSDYMTFLGDEGRDALIVKKILTEGDLPFIGPPTSVGNIYLGPLYYYMMTVPMAIFWLNPIAGAGMVAGIGVATVMLIFYLARVWFGFWPAVLSAGLYAISSVAVTYSRSSWNPNPAPFFTLLAILGFYQAAKLRNFYWLILVGFAAAAAIQMHYLALILLPIMAVYWFYELALKLKGQKEYFFVPGTILGILIFLTVMFPLVLFDFKHNFLNYRAMIALFTSSEGGFDSNILEVPNRIFSLYNDKLIGRYITAENWLLTPLVALSCLIPLFILCKRWIFRQNISWPYFALGVWVVVGILGLSLLNLEIFDHYLGFVNPAPFLLLAGVIVYLKGYWQGAVVVVLVLVLGTLNLQRNPLMFPPNNQLAKTQQITKFIISKSGNKPFNFALIAKNNYDSAYKFYLEMYGSKPKVVPLEITDQLFVVCEDPVCQPIGHPKQEISHFGWAIVDTEEDFAGVKVFRLIHNPDQEDEK